MKKIPITRWLTLFVLFAFLFNACSTSTQNATATEVTPSQTYAPTETFTPVPTATQTETAIASNTPVSSPTVEAQPSAIASTTESVVTKSMIVLSDSPDWLVINDKSLKDKDNPPVVRGLTYAELQNAYDQNWFITPIIIRGGSPTPIPVDDSVPIDAFKKSSFANKASDSPVTLDDVNSGRYAAWFRKAFELGPNDVVILGSDVDSKLFTESIMNKWTHEEQFIFVGNARFDGNAAEPNDPLVLNYFNTHPLVSMGVNNAGNSGDFSLLDGALFELIVAISSS